MTTKLIQLILVVFIANFFSCKLHSNAVKNKKDVDANNALMDENSMNSLDWQGSYIGDLPCADCEGIQTEISLYNDLSYKIQLKYAGKSTNAVESYGTFSWNKDGNSIVLNNINTKDFPSLYKVGENTLTQLDLKGNIIAGALAEKYILKKAPQGITDKYWRLIELHGQPIILTDNGLKEPHLILKSKGNNITGNGSCNSFFGSFEMSAGYRIVFSKIGATEMACGNMEIEMEFFKVLNMTDNFSTNGDTLALNKAKMTTLARFVIVNLK